MTRRIFDHDPLTGVTQYFHDLGNGDGSFAIEDVQADISPLIDANRASFNEISSGRSSWGDGATLDARSHVASIPPVIHAQLIRNGTIRDPVALKRWLNDPDNAVFRTRPGVI